MTARPPDHGIADNLLVDVYLFRTCKGAQGLQGGDKGVEVYGGGVSHNLGSLEGHQAC
jgi:hypothetical protein